LKYKFYSPFIIWFGIWLFICLVMSLITFQINKFNMQSTLARERLLNYHRPYGPFSQQFGFSPDSGEGHQFSANYRQLLGPEPYSAPSFLWPVPATADRGWRESSLDYLWTRHLLLKDQRSTTYAGHLFTILSYLLFVVGFGAICLISAIYQNYFRRALEEQFEVEIEARNLRIQVLESSRDALDLKLQLLDQTHERALTAAQEAQENIRDLEEKLQSEADRNDELQAELQVAFQEENKLLTLLRSLDRDRRKLAAEKMDIASLLAAAETSREEDLYRRKVRKARSRLRLHAIWLTSLYQNLSFSPRALQNIGELQEVSEVFPSLPQALAQINQTSYEALKSGANLPPKTVARFTTQDLEHFGGPFWEYRFSADGRIFFGLSKTRTWNIDTILLKRRFPDKKEKFDRYLAATLGKDNQDLQLELIS
jgi:hypothetical protein